MSFQACLYRFFLALASLAQLLPRRTALWLGAGFASAVYALYRLTPYRYFIQRNLRGAFGDAPDAWIHRQARAHLVQLTRAIVEVLRLPTLDREFDQIVRFEGWENLEGARARGKGVVLVTGHFGNWEIMGAAFAHRGVPLHVLVQRPSQDAFDRLFKEFRARVGVSSWANTGPASLRPVLRALARNEALGLLVDQHGEAQEAIVRFFGHSVSAPTGPVFFAERTGAAMVPVFAVRQPDGTHLIEIGREIVPSGNAERDMQAIYAILEHYIRLYPSQWLWVHDRWAREHELRRFAPLPDVVEVAS